MSTPPIVYLQSSFYLFLNYFLILFIYFDKEKEQEWGKGGERGRERERKSQTRSEQSAQNPMQGLNSPTERSWSELKSRVDA